MKQDNNKTKFYELNECKTEFLFESDAEKVVLKEAANARKKQTYKKIIIHSVFIAIILCGSFIALGYYENASLNKIKASLIGKNNNTARIKEVMNDSSKNLKNYDINYDNKYEIIVNKKNPVSENIVKNYEQVTLKDNLYGEIRLEEETYKNYMQLKKNLSERGYYINIQSGYQTFDETNSIYKEYENKNGSKEAERLINKAGTSEHNLGIGFDFSISKDKNGTKTNTNSDEYKYLENIAYLYGFIIRYPKDKEIITGYSYEPCHLRYVGKELAKYLTKNNLTLEEYYNLK